MIENWSLLRSALSAVTLTVALLPLLEMILELMQSYWSVYARLQSYVPSPEGLAVKTMSRLSPTFIVGLPLGECSSHRENTSMSTVTF